jgi:hypothetical protein
MKSLRKPLVVVALALVAPALVACGGSGKKAAGAPSSTPSSSQTSTGAAGVVLHEDGFSVRLPSQASPHTQSVQSAAGPVTVTLYIAPDGDGGNYLVAMTAVPTSGVVDLNGAVKGAASNVGGTVVSSVETSYLGYAGRDAKITATSGAQSVTVFSRFLNVDSKLFQLQYISPKANLSKPPAAYAEVLKSVQFD